VHPDTAARFGIADEEWMVVETPRGAIHVKARVTKTIPVGIVCVQSGWVAGLQGAGAAALRPL